MTLDPIRFQDIGMASSQLAFQVSTERLLDIYYENYWPACPVPLPLHHLKQRRLTPNHGMDNLLLVLQWIGSIFAPWTVPGSHYETARRALESPMLPRTPWSVQALMLFAAAQRHCNLPRESRQTLNTTIAIALELQMNTREFAVSYGEGDSVVEESWRRTYYFLVLSDQHFSIVVNNPVYTLMSVPNLVELPCDDEYYEAGNIPLAATWQQYDMREFDDVEVVYSSITYMVDVSRISTYIMQSFMDTGTFNAAFVASIDAKLAVWHSLLPAVKKDPMRQNGTVDEIMFMAHLMATILAMACNRPFSSLAYSFEELTTTSFAPAVPFMDVPKNGRPMHTARTLKACDTETRLLAIPCAVERHNVFTICIVASVATAQVAACKMLDDRALSIARDRVRLSIGFLNAMGAFWPTAKTMAKEVRFVARSALAGLPSTVTSQSDATAEVEIARDGIIWPIDPSAQIDIYAGITLPMDFDAQMINYASSSSSSL
ncbi:hypothetical protein N0V90_002773 [Kalmusia sp. IMI 367209]|nr:hypothetical protein N0V90_002773 [Kalmusia sp. IMI 367209]